MSLESAKMFIEKMRIDREFAEKVRDCNDSAARWEFVKEAGFDFTAEEIQKVQMELTDEELDMVAGGTWSNGTIIQNIDFSNGCFPIPGPILNGGFRPMLK